MFFFFILKSFTKELATKESIAQEKTIAAKLQKNEAQVEQLYKEWNNKWKETHKIMEVGLIMFLFFIFTIVQLSFSGIVAKFSIIFIFGN